MMYKMLLILATVSGFVFKDREGDFWFSTLNNGLLFVKDIDTKLYFKDLSPLKSYLVQNKLYLGTSSGKLYGINLETMESTALFQSKLNPEISTLFIDTINNNILLSNRILEAFKQSPQPFFAIDGAVKDMKLVGDNYYAIAMSGCASLYRINNAKKDSWTKLYQKNINIDGTARFIIGCRARATEYLPQTNTIYFGTSYGLFYLTPEGIKELKQDTAKLYVNRLTRFKNTIYGTTVGSNLLNISNNKLSFIDLNFKDKDETISLMKICGNFMFICTNSRLYSIDLLKPEFNLVLQHLLDFDVTDIELHKGKIILINKNGVIIEDIKTNSEENENSVFRFNKVLVNGYELENIESLELTHDQNNVEIIYSILSFKTDSYFPLYYKINNRDWELANGRSRSIKLSSLAPGRYSVIFKLGAPSNSLYKTSKIDFVINEPFWQTWWFTLIWMVLILIAILSFFRWRIKELNAKNELLEEKVKNEQLFFKTSMKAIRAQMNPHFFYNALNTIQSFIYSEDKQNASTYLSKFSKLTRLVLEMSEKENITLTEELEAIRLYLDIEKVRFNDDFIYNINTPNTINSDTVLFPPMLIQPYVENAIKHGLLHKKGEKQLKIDFNIEGGRMIVSIDDNGIGRKQSAEINAKKMNKPESFSTKANQERLDILSRNNNTSKVEILDKFDSTSGACGTKVVLNIQLIPFTN
jgi:two-component sensor histidine kinase